MENKMENANLVQNQLYCYDLTKSIDKLFEEQVEKTPNQDCVHFEGRNLTYFEVNEFSNILAWRIRNLGVKCGNFIAVALPRSENLVVSILSILKLDCVYVPIDLSNPLGRLEYILEDSGPTLLICTKESENLFRNCYKGKIFVISGEILSDSSPDLDYSGGYRNLASTSESLCGERVAYLIYTSGSTGKPKGVCCTHKGLVNRICWMRDHYQINSNDKILHKTPISFDVSLWELLLPLISGACLIVAAPDVHKDSLAIMDLVEKECITVIHFVPSMFRAFLQASDSFDSCVSLRYIFSSGEALGIDVAKLFFEKFAKISNNTTSLQNLYGPTEAAIDVSYFECRPTDVIDSISIPIGKPIVNTQLYVLDEYLRPVASMVPGELYIGGVGLAKEYLNRSDLTQKHFLPNPFGADRLYRTGDLARLRVDGNIEFLGRIDTQVKIRGYRIELGEIESTIMKYPGVTNAAVVARDDLIINSKVLVGYVITNMSQENLGEDESSFISRLNESLNNTLPSYMIPSKYVFMDEFPLTLSGKLDRKALPKPVTITSVSCLQQSRTEMENSLLKIWAGVMGLEEIGVRDNFFQIGGDSIISMQIRSRAKDYGVQLSVKDIFDYPTIQQLAVILQCRAKEKQTVPEEEQCKLDKIFCEIFGEIPLTPVQCWFFEQNFENVNFWNQYILVKPNIFVEQYILYKALEALTQFHAILNVRYQNVEENDTVAWYQYCKDVATTSDRFILVAIDLKSSKFENNDEKIKTMDEHRYEIEKSIDIQSGVLWGVILFEFDCKDQRLIFFAHHLLMDGVSLRIIVSDLEKLYQNILSNMTSTEEGTETVRKTTSFRNWSLILTEYAKNNDFSAEKDYWVNLMESSKDFVLPLQDLSFSAGQAIHTTSLNSELTYNLIHKANLAYKTEINDILLTAFAIVISEWVGQQRVLIELEGHGRDEEIKFGNMVADLTKTVGWFTTMFPVCLHIENPLDLGHSLKAVKEQLRKIPQKGINYGIIKYLKKDIIFNEFKKEPEICFNYLGQFDNTKTSNNWAILKSEDSLSMENHLHKNIIVDSIVCEGSLEIFWRYKNCISPSIIEDLAKKFVGKLEELISHCDNDNYFGYSPSDFPLLQKIYNLDQKCVDESFASIRGIIDVFPLTPMQMGMYFNNCLDPQADNYVVQKIYEINGDLQIDIFEMSWRKIVAQCDILRTGYTIIAGVGIPVQFVLSSAELSIKYLDWTTTGSNNKDKNISFRKLIFEDRRKMFSLKYPPLMRILLVKISSSEFLLLWTMHHIILDGWSTEILFQKLLSSYNQMVNGHFGDIMYSSSFREHISWLGDYQRRGNEKALEYFENYLREYAPKESLTSIYSSLARNQEQVSENPNELSFAHVDLKVPETVLSKLKETASLFEVTLSTLVELTWGILLARLTGNNDVVFGLTVSGRSEQQNDDILGLLINTLPVRIHLNGNNNDNLQVMLHKLQGDIRKLEEFSYLSLAEVQAASLQHVGSVSELEKLFDTILVFESFPVDSLSLYNGKSSLEVTCTETIESTEYPLTVVVATSINGGISIRLNYKRQYFSKSHAKDILHSFNNLLEDIATHREKSWRELSILSKEDIGQLLLTGKGPFLNLESFSNILDLILENVEKIPNSVAVIDGDRKIAYKCILDVAIKIAFYLKATVSDTEGKYIAIILERSAELIFAIVAVLILGGVYIPIDPSTPDSRIRFILDDTNAVAVITVNALKNKTKGFGGKIISMDDNNFNDISSEEIPVKNLCPSDNIYAIYTSGSTGNPKGCVINHENLMNYLLWAKETYCNDCSAKSTTSADLIPLHSSISFDLSITSVFLPLISGKTIVIAPESLGIIGLLDILKNYEEFSILKVTPSHLDIIYETFREPGSLPKVKCLVIGGENLLASQIHRWCLEQPETKIFNEYGPTECTVGCTAFEITMDSVNGNQSFHSVPIGRPIANTFAFVLDESMGFVPKYVLGELYIGGKGVTNGYLNLPEKTKENFISNPFGEGLLYRTGDTVRLSDNSVLEYLGRSDRQVKIRGYRIEIGEIEFALRNIKCISEVAVVLRNGELNAFVVISNAHGNEIEKAEIISQLKKKLPTYMIPSNIIVIGKLPITSSGKIDTHALQNYNTSDEKSLNDKECSPGIFSDDSNDLENKLALIWKEILGIGLDARITNEDNFFQLGGHSLTALRFVHLTKTRLGISFPLSKIFEIPTLKELAVYIEKLNCPIQFQSMKNLPKCIVTVNGNGDKTPMFLVHSGFGIATEYLSLAELDRNRPIYGINTRRFSTEHNYTELEENNTGINSIQEMANCYVNDVLCVRSEGPFIIGGWSFGGVVALEMAHILKQRNKEVELVVLLDSFYNKKPNMQKGNADVEANFPTLSDEERNIIYKELENNCKLLKSHEVKSNPDQKVVLIKAKKSDDFTVIAEDDHNGWKGIIPQLKIINISTSHYLMFHPDYIGGTVTALQQALEISSW